MDFGGDSAGSAPVASSANSAVTFNRTDGPQSNLGLYAIAAAAVVLVIALLAFSKN